MKKYYYSYADQACYSNAIDAVSAKIERDNKAIKRYVAGYPLETVPVSELDADNYIDDLHYKILKAFGHTACLGIIRVYHYE